MKKLLLIFIMPIFLFSCERVKEQVKKDFQTTNRHYFIECYSGGILIKSYEFIGILNNSEESDGYYFYNSDTLIEISGDILIKSVKVY